MFLSFCAALPHSHKFTFSFGTRLFGCIVTSSTAALISRQLSWHAWCSFEISFPWNSRKKLRWLWMGFIVRWAWKYWDFEKEKATYIGLSWNFFWNLWEQTIGKSRAFNMFTFEKKKSFGAQIYISISMRNFNKKKSKIFSWTVRTCEMNQKFRWLFWINVKMFFVFFASQNLLIKANRNCQYISKNSCELFLEIEELIGKNERTHSMKDSKGQEIFLNIY